MARRAKSILDAHSAKKARRRVKAAPRRKVERATKAQRQENWQTVKEAVEKRSGCNCERCGLAGSDPHHLLSGPLRRKYETPATVACLCRTCHALVHSGASFALEDIYMVALKNSAPDIVLAALRRRIQKATQRTA